jgi:hypothetical protein
VVWGVITTLALVYGVYQLRRSNKNEWLHGKVAPRLILLYTLFTIWLWAAEEKWLMITVIVFIVMYFILRSVMMEMVANRHTLTVADKVLLLTQIGIYTGWTTVAVFANTASAIKFYGISDAGSIGTVWQSLLLISAAANIAWGINSFKGELSFVATTLWAIVGIYVGLLDEVGAEVLKSVTLVLGALIIIYMVLYWRQHHFFRNIHRQRPVI